MVAEPAAGLPPADTSQAYTPPNPQAEAQRLLEEGEELLTLALDVLRSDRNAAKSSDLVGRASDRIGSALHYMRQLIPR